MDMELLFNSLTYFELFALILCCFLGAAITTSVGMGGGILIIGGMSLILPIAALIPIHALTQGIAGINRAYIFRKDVMKLFFILFILGTAIGFTLAINFLVTLSEDNLKLILGIGLIVLNFLPTFKVNSIPRKSIFFTGSVTGFLTMFIGVMGPIVGILLNSFIKERHIIVATVAWCLSFQNIGKAIIFTNIGFDYTPWLILILLLIIASYFGTIVGKRMLDKSNNILFKKVLKIVILVLASKLIFEALV